MLMDRSALAPGGSNRCPRHDLTTAVDTFGMPVDSGVLDASADNGFGLFSGDNLLIGASILGVAAAGVGGYFLYQSLTDDDDSNGGSSGGSSGEGSTDRRCANLIRNGANNCAGW